MERKDLPDIGEPGTAADFQLERLREWGLGELADACTSREQALLVHHCALYVRNVWMEMKGVDQEPPVEAVRQCIEKIMQQPEMQQRVEHFSAMALTVDDRPTDVTQDPVLYGAVKADLATIS